jgi:hypothetical protein
MNGPALDVPDVITRYALSRGRRERPGCDRAR